MKKIIFRKLLLDYMSFFLIALFSSGIVIWVFQAVNFLDIMIEDGRSYSVYISYSLLNFPKILNKLFPFVLFFSLVSLILFAYLLDNTSSYKSLIFGFFLLSINIFHIKYSQELRSYIVTFVLALIFIILNFKKGKIVNNFSYKKILTITFLSILMVLNHSFSILILLSLILFKLLSFFKTKKITIEP